MSRKRDTNWSRDEITILLDSIMDITRLRAADGKRTNSKEVFEYAAKKMGEKGHQSRAEREKCRTKWKKMKEEFTHAKRAREGDTRYKEAPGIQPFYNRMEEFINGNYDNISPHSTIVRRTSSLSNNSSSSQAASKQNNNNSNHHQQLHQQTHHQQTSNNNLQPMSPEKRASARLAATHNQNQNHQQQPSTNGLLTSCPTTIDNNHDTSSATTIVTRANTTTSNTYPSSMHTTSNSGTPPSRLNSRLSSAGSSSKNNTTTPTTISTNSNSNSNNASSTSNVSANAAATTTTNTPNINNNNNNHHHHHHTSTTSQKTHEQRTPLTQNGGLSIYTAYNNEYPNSNSASTTGSSHVHSGSNDLISASPPEQADISYRVSSGCRQITIFGDHDVDIKFRRDRVTINKIDVDFQTTEA